MTFEIIQLIASLIGSFCFGVLFNMRGKKLLATALGGFMSWGLFLIISRFISSEAINYFIIASIVSLYAEIMAKTLKTPSAPLVTTSLIPLIPGSSLYYTMAYAFESDFTMFLENAITTLKLTSALALGIIVVASISQILFMYKKKIKM